MVIVSRVLRVRAVGFTLIELMIVLAIVGVLSAFSLPGFNHWMSNAQLKSVSEILMSGIRSAQSEAVNTGQNVQFVLTNDDPATGAASSTTGKNWLVQSMQMLNPATADALLSAEKMSGQYPAISVLADTAVLSFNEIGRINNIAQNVNIELSHQNTTEKLRISIATTGALRLCNPAKTRASAPDGC